MKPSVLIGCEESQVVTRAMRAAGLDAYSCDLLPTRGNPAWHIRGDVMQAVASRTWSLVILHPDCTKMAVSGNGTYGSGRPRHTERADQIEWTLKLWRLACRQSEHVALENPASVIFPRLRQTPTCHSIQYIQPWMFGHGETKKTGLALYHLPELQPTNVVEGREQRIWKMPPGPNRKRDRSVTYAGIAEAMAEQWGRLVARDTFALTGAHP